jgi:serine phosphatase RsbU (regulator of sigma subunit)/Tfp pilus assembly protein PilF
LTAFISLNTFAQGEMDSLWSVWNDESEADTVRLLTMNAIVRKGFLFATPDSAFDLLQLQYEFAKSKENSKWMASARSLQGVTFHIRGNFSEAIKFYNESLVHAEKNNDQKLIANSLNNIGIIHKEQRNFDKALEYFKKSYTIKKEIGDKMGFSNSLGNIGGVYSAKGEDEKAIDYYDRGLRIQEELGNKRGIAGFLNNIGSIFIKRGEDGKAMDYFTRSLTLREEIGDKRGQASCLKNISELYMVSGEVNKAIAYAMKGKKIAESSGALLEAKSCTEVLYKCFKYKGDTKNALEMYELFVVYKDSIDNEENQQEVIRQTYKYEYAKQHLADSLAFVQEQELKDIQHQSQLDKEQNQRYLLYVGILFLLVLGGFIFKGYQSKKRDHRIIEAAHQELGEKNQEIMDSIIYAKRIQKAILPPESVVKKHLNDCFIIYKPKDIVAGDFYWMETRNEKTLLAVADCTGHGVPGAMVSVVCNSGLNRSVREHGLTTPGEILDKTREIVVEEFEKSEEEVKDGMDIALVSLKGKDLRYAGAHNPLWIIRKGELIEIKADKQPIGKFENPSPYETHAFETQKDDVIYLFSDGFADQFGGEKGKKFKSANLKKLLLSAYEKPMQEQKEIINGAFESWKGSLDQIDDVCLIGVRL